MFRFAAALALFLIALPSHTQTVNDSAPIKTIGLINGRGWMSMADASRVWYIAGSMDALASRCGTETKLLFSVALSVGDLKNALNKFYEEPTNVAIPVTMAMNVVKMKADGASAEAVEKETALDRQLAAILSGAK